MPASLSADDFFGSHSCLRYPLRFAHLKYGVNNRTVLRILDTGSLTSFEVRL